MANVLFVDGSDNAIKQDGYETFGDGLHVYMKVCVSGSTPTR